MRTERKLIVDLIAENRERVEAGLCDLFSRWADDLVAAGVDGQKVSDALLNVAVVHSLKKLGPQPVMDAVASSMRAVLGEKNASAMFERAAGSLAAGLTASKISEARH